MSRAPLVRFVNAHYAPDEVATSEFLTDLAEGLVSHGYRVHVVTGSRAYGTSAVVGRHEEVRNGVPVTRVRSSALGRKGLIRRAVDYAAFVANAATPTLGGERADLTIYLTTPPLLGALGWAGWRFGGRPYGLWLMDLHPDAEIVHGILPASGPIFRAARGVDRAILRRARIRVALGRCMADRVRATLPGVDVDMIPLWKDPGEVGPVPRPENPLARAWNVGDRFVVMYSGTAGLAHRFDEVREVIRRFRGDPRVLFLFVGNGERRADMERFIREERVENARYQDPVQRADVPSMLSLADLHLVTLQPSWNGIAVPSKIFGILASGRPVAVVGPPSSEASRVVEETGAGRVFDPDGSGAAEGLARFVEELLAAPAMGMELGRAGRAGLVAGYSRTAGIERWDMLLKQVLGVSPSQVRLEEADHA